MPLVIRNQLTTTNSPANNTFPRALHRVALIKSLRHNPAKTSLPSASAGIVPTPTDLLRYCYWLLPKHALNRSANIIKSSATILYLRSQTSQVVRIIGHAHR